MKPFNVCALAAVSILIQPVYTSAADTIFTRVNHDNTVPGVVANGLFTDSGNDLVFWATAVLLVDLTSGSVYNASEFDSAGSQGSLWPFIPELEFDSWVGIPLSGANGIAGGAGELGGPGGANQVGLLGTDAQPQTVSVSWFCSFCTLPQVSQIANISLSDDAAGTWTMRVGFLTFLAPLSEVPPTTTISGSIINGVMVPEPGTLAVLGVGGVALLCRERNKQ